jgi:hypothetical protein
MPSSIYDFRAIAQRVNEISEHTLNVGRPAPEPKPPCCMFCSGVGWILVPDPRVGHPDSPCECTICHNPEDRACPYAYQVAADARPIPAPQGSGGRAARSKPWPSS